MVRLDTLQILRGTASAKAFAWAVDNRETLAARWDDLNG